MKKLLNAPLLALITLLAVAVAPTQASAAEAPCSRGSAKKRQGCIVNQIVTNVNLGNVAEQYTRFYAADAQFNDPTITVDGRDAIIAHLQQALSAVSVDAIRVRDTVETDGRWITTYEMDTHLLIPVNGTPVPVGQQITLVAATVLEFDCHNRIVYHRDYYDQFAVYQQIPNFAATVQGLLFQYIGSLFGQ